MEAVTFRFRVGRFECLAVEDGYHDYSPDQYFANAEPELLARGLAAHGVAGVIRSPYSALLVRAGTLRILIDTGGGNFAPGMGKLMPSLVTLGMRPEDIDAVVITHGHPDHLGGTLDGQGRPAFPHARYLIQQAEWEYWTTAACTSHPVNKDLQAFALRHLQPLGNRLEMLAGEREIVEGITAVPAPGHTPGHMVIAINSQGDELLYISDLVIHPLHLEHPEWYPVFDADPAQAIESKAQIFGRAAAGRALVLAFHFPPFPSLGHVIAESPGWRWQPAVSAIPVRSRQVHAV